MVKGLVKLYAMEYFTLAHKLKRTKFTNQNQTAFSFTIDMESRFNLDKITKI